MNNIYHYTDFKTAKRFILKNLNLKLGSIVKTNDPRENKNFRFGYIRYSNSEDLPETKHSLYYESIVNELLRRNIKVQCFSTDYTIGREGFFGYNLSRMWATYGDFHKGVCFEIDFDKFKEVNSDKISDSNFKNVKYVPPSNNSDFPIFDITYAEEIGVEEYCKYFIKQYWDYFYFTKLKDWESEHEIRLLHIGNDSIKEFCSIRDCLKSVILGVNASKYKIKKIRGLIPDGVPLMKVEFEYDRLIAIPI